MNASRLRLIRLLSAAVAFIVCTGNLPAQTSQKISPDHVTFYAEPNFQGEALTVEAGAAIENLDRTLRANQRPWTASISSVLVAGAARATVFAAPGFGGDRLEITRSIADLYSEARGRDGSATWDRAIAAVTVTSPQRTTATQVAPPSTPPSAYPTSPPPPPTRAEPPPTVVIVQPPPPRPPPPVIVQQVHPRIDRRMAEMIIDRAYREVLDRPADPEGLHRYRDRVMREGWSERQVIEQLQRSSEARAIKADDAINKIYREVLGRPADPQGLAHYRAKWREGWTQGQIREDLRRSHEGRDNRIRDAIVRAYREVLGREPDPSGYATYEKLMRERGYTERDVRRALTGGDEYRQKMGKSR